MRRFTTHERPTGATHPLVAGLLQANPDTLLRDLVATPTDLLQREEAMVQAGRQAGLAAQPIGTWPLFERYRLYSAEPNDWVLINLADDPLLGDPDGYPIPYAVLKRLRRLHRSGARLDALAVAHELPKGRLAPGGPLTAAILTPGPSGRAQQTARRLGATARGLWTAAAAPIALAAFLGAGALTLTAAGAAAGGLLSLDPVLFGAVVAPGRPAQAGEPARWIYLDHWFYDTAEV